MGRSKKNQGLAIFENIAVQTVIVCADDSLFVRYGPKDGTPSSQPAHPCCAPQI